MLIATTERVAGHEVAETLGEIFGTAPCAAAAWSATSSPAF
jgi:uncharacterized protein YbjQ (UPF0145 family)